MKPLAIFTCIIIITNVICEAKDNDNQSVQEAEKEKRMIRDKAAKLNDINGSPSDAEIVPNLEGVHIHDEEGERMTISVDNETSKVTKSQATESNDLLPVDLIGNELNESLASTIKSQVKQTQIPNLFEKVVKYVISFFVDNEMEKQSNEPEEPVNQTANGRATDQTVYKVVHFDSYDAEDGSKHDASAHGNDRTFIANAAFDQWSLVDITLYGGLGMFVLLVFLACVSIICQCVQLASSHTPESCEACRQLDGFVASRYPTPSLYLEDELMDFSGRYKSDSPFF
ncbi:hypothetical protein HDE_13864 [Halotydeus destructor]|nr:hypothetical protein HDE_13864 [Halotydeus destructor]